jgi:hypothetical protein
MECRKAVTADLFARAVADPASPVEGDPTCGRARGEKHASPPGEPIGIPSPSSASCCRGHR